MSIKTVKDEFNGKDSIISVLTLYVYFYSKKIK